jgi:FdhD protein
MTKNTLIPYEILKISGTNRTHVNDLVSVEEPLEISIQHGLNGFDSKQNVAITMRTPGFDADLAVGFLFTEGIINKPEDILNVDVFESRESENTMQHHSVSVILKEDVIVNLKQLERNFYTTSSCGVCGKASIDAVKMACPIIIPQKKWKISPETIMTFPSKLRNAQLNFEYSGGIHAAALFDLSGECKFIREDVGRHNALDKLLGFAFTENIIPCFDFVLLLSGRASFELVQKASMAGIRMICAMGAPSSLAIDLAEEYDITLVGFLKENRFNVYSAPERMGL